MKRFASHYLLIPAVGYMKQQVVEITDDTWELHPYEWEEND